MSIYNSFTKYSLFSNITVQRYSGKFHPLFANL